MQLYLLLNANRAVSIIVTSPTKGRSANEWLDLMRQMTPDAASELFVVPRH